MIIIVDYGSQYTQLIARRVREQGVYCEIVSCLDQIPEKTKFDLAGFILSGGPSSVYSDDAPKLPEGILDSGKPVLGICYGAQLMAYSLGGGVQFAKKREYGFTEIQIDDYSDLFKGFEDFIANFCSIFLIYVYSVRKINPLITSVILSKYGSRTDVNYVRYSGN